MLRYYYVTYIQSKIIKKHGSLAKNVMAKTVIPVGTVGVINNIYIYMEVALGLCSKSRSNILRPTQTSQPASSGTTSLSFLESYHCILKLHNIIR